MGKEIERKYLIKNEDWKAHIESQYRIQQGYLNSTPERVVRIRLRDQTGIITIKGKTQGITRAEYEYEIPYEDALELLKLCETPPLVKTRFIVKVAGKQWEIDIFEGDNKGLSVAEIELRTEEEAFEKPTWLGQEVTHDKKYLNACLIQHPYQKWS